MSIQVLFRNSKVMLALWWLYRPLARAGKCYEITYFGSCLLDLR